MLILLLLSECIDMQYNIKHNFSGFIFTEATPYCEQSTVVKLKTKVSDELSVFRESTSDINPTVSASRIDASSDLCFCVSRVQFSVRRCGHREIIHRIWSSSLSPLMSSESMSAARVPAGRPETRETLPL